MGNGIGAGNVGIGAVNVGIRAGNVKNRSRGCRLGAGDVKDWNRECEGEEQRMP